MPVPVKADVDERDLRLVVIGTYVFAGIIGLGVLLSAFALASALFSGGVGLTGIIVAALSIAGGILYAWANVNSARAIAAREAPHFSFFVAGMNMMVFPFGTLLSICTWRVLTRPSVQQIYADPHRAPSLPPTKDKKKATIPKQQTSAVPEPTLEDLTEAEEELWREMEKEHRKNTAGGAIDKFKKLRPGDEETP